MFGANICIDGLASWKNIVFAFLLTPFLGEMFLN